MGALGNPPKITPFLWFDKNAEEAVEFYLSVFKNSRRLDEMRMNGDGGPVPQGTLLTMSFELEGHRFTALNGGPAHKFTDAISFVVSCETQAEIDEYWAALTDGGSEVACGWLKDKFGLSWQIVPVRLGELLKYPKAMQALMHMKKLDIGELERAAE